MLTSLTTDQKGAIAETAIAHRAVKLGIDVYRPVAEGGRYDLIFALDSRLVRVQCKWAVRCGDVVIVRVRSCRRGPNGMIHRSYSVEEIDVVAAYCAELDRCYFMPFARFPRRAAIYLRLRRTRNNQERGVIWAHDFELERLNLLANVSGP